MKVQCILALLLIVATVHAQDCGGVNAGGVCVPPDVAMPGYQQQAQQPPPQKWVDHWGAIATNEPTGSLGVANDMASQSDAEQAALADCQSKQGATCKLETSYRNGCGALIGSSTGYVVVSKATLNETVQTGISTCTKAGYSNCHVYYSACSLPVRIQ